MEFSPMMVELGKVEIRHIYISPGHNYFGHHGNVPDTHPSIEVTEVHCLEGRGLEGDRFLDYKDDYKGQVTFFALEVYEDLCRKFAVRDKAPSAFRRNIITRGVDLNSLVGEEFEVQGLRFLGTAECSPCSWMDEAFHAGAEAALKGRGGLRAKILTSGWLRSGE